MNPKISEPFDAQLVAEGKASGAGGKACHPESGHHYMNVMKAEIATTKSAVSSPTVPLSLQLAEPVERVAPSGSYVPSTQTWSNRTYETAASKKHNEDM